MLEFVLVLPFVWIVLALTFNSGLAFLERQRSMVALREFGVRHSVSVSGNEAERRTVGDPAAAVAADTLRPRRMTGTFAHDGSRAGCPGGRAGGAADDSGRLLHDLSRFMARLSATQTYDTSAQGQPLVGRLLRKPRYRSCFAIDINPWNYHEMPGGALGWLSRQVPGLGSL